MKKQHRPDKDVPLIEGDVSDSPTITSISLYPSQSPHFRKRANGAAPNCYLILDVSDPDDEDGKVLAVAPYDETVATKIAKGIAPDAKVVG